MATIIITIKTTIKRIVLSIQVEYNKRKIRNTVSNILFRLGGLYIAKKPVSDIYLKKICKDTL
jgi:hypothetical protein